MKLEAPHLPEKQERTQNLSGILSLAAKEERDICRSCFENASVAGIDLPSIEFRGCCFQGCRFTDFSAHRAFFTDVSFADCDLSNLTFEGCGFRRVEFQRCKAVGTVFPEAYFEQVFLWKSCIGEWINLTASKLKNVRFQNCRLSEGNFESCVFSSIEFSGCNLQKAIFLHTPLEKIDFSGNNIDGIVLAGPELHGAVVEPLQAAGLAHYLGLIVR